MLLVPESEVEVVVSQGQSRLVDVRLELIRLDR
jgi:hypothetical protein